MLVSSSASPPSCGVGHHEGQGPVSPRTPSTQPLGANPEVPEVHGPLVLVEGLCLSHPHPLPSNPQSPGGILVSPACPVLCPSCQPQVFCLKMLLIALPSIFVSWPLLLHPPSSLTAWVGLLRGFPHPSGLPPHYPPEDSSFQRRIKEQ